MIANRDDYKVEIVPIEEVKPSPENDDIYGKVQWDEQMEALVKSIGNRGLEEPIIISDDNYVISGHRRLFACREIGMDSIPIRRKKILKRAHQHEWHAILSEYNPQRIKSARALLKEAMLRHTDNPQQLLRSHRESEIENLKASFTEVPGIKNVDPIGERQQEFLEAAIKVVYELQEFWPLQVRQIHYRLLNDPPLTQTAKRSSKPPGHWRYANTDNCYTRLTKMLVPARYYGHIPWEAIDDPTRPFEKNEGWFSLSEYIDREMSNFLCNYHRDRQRDQPRHIECLGEKNTLLQIIKPICREYYIPMTIGRGVCSHPVWRDMAARFHESGKDRMTLLVLSDHDAAGLDLADDAIRSLRDLWGIPVDYDRVGVHLDQIESLNLANDFNPEKADGSKLARYVERTGSDRSWELEALDPSFIQSELRKHIEANMDMEIHRKTGQAEQDDVRQLAELRAQIV